MAMSRLTENLLSGLDYEGIRQKRNENWMQLHAVLGNHNRLSLHTPDGPYMYPYYCENGMQIKKKLAEKKIYIPTLWPNVLEAEENELEKDYTRNILPLPVDQRYGLADMTRLLKALEECK